MQISLLYKEVHGLTAAVQTDVALHSLHARISQVFGLNARMGPTLFCELCFFLLLTLLFNGQAQDAVLTTDPSWSTFFKGESVTFICDMNEGEDADWEYKINKDEQEYFSYSTSKVRTLTPLSTGDSGVYQCVGRRKSSHDTKSSNTVSSTVSAKPRATLTAGTTTISVGGSVTLTCSVQNSTGWKYVWFRRTKRTSEVEVSPVVTNDEQNRVISVSQGGIYRCLGTRGEPVYYTHSSNGVTIEITFSNEAVLRRQPNWSQMFSGERITLTCEVHGGETTEWVYDWRRPGPYEHWTYNNDLTWSVSESNSGDYMCRSRHRDDSYSSTEWSKAVTLSVSRKPKALLNADIRDIPVGGSVTLICSVKPSSGWEYYWYRDDKFSEPLTTKDAVFHLNGRISVSEGGLYRCRGGRGNPVYHTEYSDPVSIRKHEAKAVLTVSPSWLSPGASVTLSCKLEHPSAGWRFYWYKTVPDLSGESYSYELLPGSSNGTEQHSYIIHGQTQTAGYTCRAGRSDQVLYTDHSEPMFVWSGDLHPAASLTVNPDTVQHFDSASISLSCEGNSTKWRVSRFTEDRSLSHCSVWGTMNGPTCNVNRIQYSNVVYWCESGSAFSNAVNITGQDGDGVILVSPVHPVTEGHSVTLGCKLRTENVLSNVLFYKDDQLIQSDSKGEMSISAVSKSDEGFYKCGYSGKESPQSWMAVKESSSENSSFPALLITGLVCGLLLIILLLLLCCYKQSKDSCFIRSRSTNQRCAADDTINQDEALNNECAFPVSGDACLYESVKDTDKDEPSDVTYSSIELKKVTKKGKKKEPEESAVYSVVKRRSSTDDSVTYAQVLSHKKGKAKRDKGESAAEETLYSEVKPGRAPDH